MEAGRWLDRLIAEKVMGDRKGDGWGWVSLDGSSITCADAGPKPYSTDIASAWNIVERMTDLSRSDWCTFEMHRSMNRHDLDSWGYTVLFGEQYNPTHQYERRVYAHTAPLAICLAALKMLGIEVTA